jgi:hypothetical protein
MSMLDYDLAQPIQGISPSTAAALAAVTCGNGG